MKKYLFLASVAALSFTACTNETEEFTGTGSENQQKEIAFFPLNQKATKAAVQGTEFPATNTMEVVAYKSSSTVTPANPAGNYFEKTTFAQKVTYWGATPAKYWPLSPATLNFYAVSAAGVNNNHITIANNLSTAGVAYTTANSYSATTQSDIMYAFERGAVTQNGDNTLSFNGGAPVAMVFKHTQAQVRFQIKAANEASEAITVNSITLNGAKYNGVLTLTPSSEATATTGTVTTTVAWSDVSEAVATQAVPNIDDYDLNKDNYYPADDADNDDRAALLIIPGTGNGFTGFTINYTYDGKAYSYTYSDAVANAAVSTVYSYKIIMQLHEITISPSVTDWSDAAGYPKTITIEE